MNKLKKFAVLIDVENTSVNHIPAIFDTLKKHKIDAYIKQAYGDWSNNALKFWPNILNSYAIRPIHCFSIGSKNITDMRLIIDTMDLLHKEKLDGFCIVSSDSDFTPLALRIRENKLLIYVFGKNNTKKEFKEACDKFFNVNNLVKGNISQSSVNNDILDRAILNVIYKAIKDNKDNDGWANFSTVAQYLKESYPDFEPSQYGYSKLSELIKALDLFYIDVVDKVMWIKKAKK